MVKNNVYRLILQHQVTHIQNYIKKELEFIFELYEKFEKIENKTIFVKQENLYRKNLKNFYFVVVIIMYIDCANFSII